jgi:polysaccharide biosynthesis protein VpsQ
MKAKSPDLSTQSPPLRVIISAGIYASLFGLILWAAYTNHLPLDFLNQIPYYDKIGHVVLYFIATYLGHRVLRQRQYRCFNRTWPLFPSLFGLFTLIEEWIQGFSPYRTLDPGDLICSFLGIGLGYIVAQQVASKQK